MLEVSANWQNASREQFRYQAYLWVQLEVSPPSMRKNAVVTSGATFEQSQPSSVIDGRSDIVDFYSSLEVNRWLLDGTRLILPAEEALKAWWSDTLVSQDYKPQFDFTFDKAYTIPGLYIVWDSENQTYPSSITVTGYDIYGVAQYVVTVDDITSYKGFYESCAMEDIKALTIVINSWAVENWRARVDEVVFGMLVEFDSVNAGRITSAKQTSKADPLNSKLPTHELEVSLRNYDRYFDPSLKTGVSKYLAQQQVLKAKWQFTTEQGVLETAPEQVYLTEKFDIPADTSEVNLRLTNRLSLLDSEFTLGNYTGTPRTLYAIAEYILSRSGVLVSETGQEPWVIAEELMQIETTAPIPPNAVNALLQLIASASCTWLTTRSTDGFIAFVKSQTDASEFCSVGKTQELGDPEVTVNDRLRSVSVGVYNYKETEKKEIGSYEYTLTGQHTLLLKYNTNFATGVTASVTGATLVSATYYASYASVTVSASDNSKVTISLSGTVVEQSVTYMEFYRNPVVINGKDVTIENPFITTVPHAQQVAEYVTSYYLKSTHYKANYIGYPQLEPADRITLSSVYDESDVDVTNNTIDFNGGWSGVLEVL